MAKLVSSFVEVARIGSWEVDNLAVARQTVVHLSDRNRLGTVDMTRIFPFSLRPG